MVVIICGKTSSIELLAWCARIFVEVWDCLILVVSIILVEPLDASTAFEFVFIGPLFVLFINPNRFDEAVNDKELEGRGLSSRVCSLRPGSPWLA